MTLKVLVHGMPETERVWAPLIAALQSLGVNDVVKLSPPGFGAPIPDGFSATRIGYRDWLIMQLEIIGQPVHLVGHDWGAGHVFAVAAARPDLIRSWAGDCAGLLDPDYVWHDAAKTWQTPKEGEKFIAELISKTGPELEALFGVPREYAQLLADHFDEPMGRCALSLYRSAAQPAMKQLGEELATASQSRDFKPGALIHATADPYVPPLMAIDVSKRTGAKLLPLAGAGHWWMYDDAQGSAKQLVDFWTTADLATRRGE